MEARLLSRTQIDVFIENQWRGGNAERLEGSPLAGRGHSTMKSQQIMGMISTAYASSDSYAKMYSSYKIRYKPD